MATDEPQETGSPREGAGPEQPPERAKQPWRPRRPSPLGLMGPPQDETPKESGLPSLRAVGFMVVFIAVVLGLVLVLGRSCH